MTYLPRITNFDRVTIHGAPFGVLRTTDDSVGLTPEGGNGETVMYSFADLQALLRDGDADLQRDYYHPDRTVCSAESPVDHLGDLDREMLELVL